MFVSKSALELFHISKDTVNDLRNELFSVSAENRILKDELAAIKANNDWYRVKVNALEYEKAALMEKAFNIKLPVPEIARATKPIHGLDMSALFEDIGDEEAKRLGLTN